MWIYIFCNPLVCSCCVIFLHSLERKKGDGLAPLPLPCNRLFRLHHCQLYYCYGLGLEVGVGRGRARDRGRARGRTRGRARDRGRVGVGVGVGLGVGLGVGVGGRGRYSTIDNDVI